MPKKPTPVQAKGKPAKPYPDFPLFPHQTRRWAKKIRGKMHYFGPWDDPDGALRRYQDQRDDLHAGRTPRPDPDALELHELANRWLTAQHRKVQAGELRVRTFSDYRGAMDHLAGSFGSRTVVANLTAEDFGRYRAEVAKTMGPAALTKRVQIVRSLFKWSFESALLDKPPRLGPDFTGASRKALRQARNKRAPRMFEAAQIRDLLDAATVPMQAMILVGVGCGWGNRDVAELPKTALDLKRGLADYPRTKTAVPRRAALWPESLSALRAAIKARPKPTDTADKGLVFITRRGQRWVRDHQHDDGKVVPVDAVGAEFIKLLHRLKMKTPGVGFYALRHVFQTVADETGDWPAIAMIMGHAESANDMSHQYRERISDDRLRKVSDHVRQWLFK